ncbi:putative transcription factor interactor and regulator CCHC(Zn) family [Helianthus annuus]|nr:putative transcription factor interactor and regulator CCHC(Zn) family [Helianthus annuus]
MVSEQAQACSLIFFPQTLTFIIINFVQSIVSVSFQFRLISVQFCPKLIIVQSISYKFIQLLLCFRFCPNFVSSFYQFQIMSVSNSNSSSIDASNPLYLHPSDHPGMILVSKSFDGTGLAAWKRGMTIALLAKNKLDFVKSEFVRPIKVSQLSLWERCNNMVISWILNTLSREIAESVLYTESAYQLWQDLNDRYGQANGAKLYQLQKNLCQITQRNNDIANYFAKVKTNWDGLSSLNLIPSCTCGAAHIIAKRDEDQRLIQFLIGLNSSYDVIRGSILMMQPLPSINQAYGILIHKEKQREISATGQFFSESASMNVSTQHQGFKSVKFDNRKDMVCTHCKKTGHLANKCYRLVGFPKDFKFTKTRRGAANMAFDSDSDSSSKVSQPSPSITVDQYNELMQMLQKNQLTKQSEPDSSLKYANFAGPFTEEATGSW